MLIHQSAVFLLFPVTYRNVVLPATSFQTPTKFIADLNSSFGGGTFLLNGCVSKSDLSEYLVSLKSDYLLQATRHYFKVPNFIGYMGNSYWYLSQKVCLISIIFEDVANYRDYVCYSDELHLVCTLYPGRVTGSCQRKYIKIRR